MCNRLGVLIETIIENDKEYRKVTIRNRTKYISKDGFAINPYHRNQIATKHENADGYLCFGGGIPVHLYVAHGWVDGYFDGAEVNHKDYNRKNNNADNLEWVTHIENVRHSSNAGRYKGRYGELNPNYNNHILHEIYANNPEYAKQKLARHGKQNGRARKIMIVDIDNRVFDTIGECAEWIKDYYQLSASINSIRQNIITSIKNNKTYRKLTFKYL